VAAIYCRISSDRAGDELGVKRQERECRQHAVRLGWRVADDNVFVDDDASAFTGRHRPGYEAMLSAIAAGAISAVIAWHPDRLHRSPKELERFIDEVERIGCRVVTVQAGELDLSTAAGRMTARVVGAVARHESEQKGERLRSKHAELARRGRWSGGSRVYGYRPDGAGSLVVVREQASVITEVATRLLRGESLYTITHDLNVRGIPTATGKGIWRLQTLRGILASGRIAGLRTTTEGEVISEATWEPIIDRATWERVRHLIDRPAGASTRSPVALLVGGSLRCGRCGASLRTQSKAGARGRIYACVKPPGGNGCGRLTIAASPLEELITETVLSALDGADFAQFTQGPESGLANTLAEDEALLAELASDYAARRIGKGEWLSARDVVEARLADTRRKLVRRTTNPFDQIDDVRSAWPSLSLDQRRSIIGAVIDFVEVQPAKRRGPVFDPDRVIMRFRA
jgi:site-specific DNA recombinase